ncbi:MAG: type II secretion system major pseudopilin GspG [Pirellulaceae bacterium]|nr:type II secretion system major pseudopilin GspG [Pirellulaceae bacterium]
MNSKRSDRSAFTLMELLLVLAILGVIMAMVVPELLGRQKYANIDATQISVRGAEQALKMYAVDHLGSMPSTAEGFAVLVQSKGSQDKRWRGPYLERLPADAWGTELKYEFPGRHNSTGFDVTSAGPDKTFGTDDDIGNWQNKD